MSAELIEHLFVAGIRIEPWRPRRLGGGRARWRGIAFSTDTFVVRPLFFPGGSIGHLAVNGTVNDLAMSGARRRTCRAGSFWKKGIELGIVGRVASDMGAAARAAGVHDRHRGHQSGGLRSR